MDIDILLWLVMMSMVGLVIFVIICIIIVIIDGLRTSLEESKTIEKDKDMVLCSLFFYQTPFSSIQLQALLPQFSRQKITTILYNLEEEGLIQKKFLADKSLYYLYVLSEEGINYCKLKICNQASEKGKYLFLAYEEKFSRKELKELYILLNHLGTQKEYMLKYMDTLIQDDLIANGKLTNKGLIFKKWVEQALHGSIDYKELGFEYERLNLEQYEVEIALKNLFGAE